MYQKTDSVYQQKNHTYSIWNEFKSNFRCDRMGNHVLFRVTVECKTRADQDLFLSNEELYKIYSPNWMDNLLLDIQNQICEPKILSAFHEAFLTYHDINVLMGLLCMYDDISWYDHIE